MSKVFLILIFIPVFISCSSSNKHLVTGHRDYDELEEKDYPLPNEDYALLYFLDSEDSDSSNLASRYIYSEYGKVAVYSPEKYSTYKVKPTKLTLFIDGIAKKDETVKRELTLDLKANHIYFITLKLERSLITGERLVTLQSINDKTMDEQFSYIKKNLDYIQLPKKALENTQKREAQFLEETKDLSQEKREALRKAYLTESHKYMMKESSDREAKGMGLDLIFRIF